MSNKIGAHFTKTESQNDLLSAVAADQQRQQPDPAADQQLDSAAVDAWSVNFSVAHRRSTTTPSAVMISSCESDEGVMTPSAVTLSCDAETEKDDSKSWLTFPRYRDYYEEIRNDDADSVEV